MYLFYDFNGIIRSSKGASNANENILTQDGLFALYLDDNNSNNKEVINNYPNYKIVNGVPIYNPILDSVKLLPLQLSKIQEINSLCNLEILDGFESSTLGGSHHYKFDMEYQSNFSEQAYLISLGLTADIIMWPTNDGVLPHTKIQFLQLLRDAGDFKSGKLFRYFSLKELIMSATTTDEVKNINWY